MSRDVDVRLRHGTLFYFAVSGGILAITLSLIRAQARIMVSGK
jgi:hypothetical protein